MQVVRTDDLEMIAELDAQAFPEAPLARHELERAAWWVVMHPDGYPVAYAGARGCETIPAVFLSRCAVMADWRGLGLQRRLLRAREKWARTREGIEAIVTYTAADNAPSMNNLIRAGYKVDAHTGAYCGAAYVYWRKDL
jgi:GNAT superfamily N-acetyltransferase